MLKIRLQNLIEKQGVLFTLILSIFCLFFFFGKLLQHPNQVYFSNGGDGMQAYYGAVYHVKHDSSYWHMDGMNYPYGEQVFFTGCQPFVTNIIKGVSTVVDISNYTIGILNCIMLFSIVLSALFLFLIFKVLKLPQLYSAIAAVAIAFLSPQLERLGGHYSLTYQFAIPLFLLLLLKFYEQPSVKLSVLTASVVFFMAGTHFYFYGFFALLALFYWLFLFLSKEREFGNIKFVLKHFFVQIISPFIVFKFIVFLIDKVNDRTNNPWGFLEYVSNLTGVFFPVGKPYSFIFESFIKPIYPTWEGYSFVGIVASLTAVGIGLILIKKTLFFQFRQVFSVTDNKLLNAFFWAGIVALLLSFGLPFKIKEFSWLYNYAGLLKQMRGIARFAWVFYYIINIITFYKIGKWAANKKNILSYFIVATSLFFVCYDAYTMSINKQTVFNNTVEQLEDVENQLPQDKWINEINSNNYQAIITLPYFNVGSENVWMETQSDIVKDVFIVSIKTGLPTTSLILSRVSLSQTYKNIQLIKDPYRTLSLLKDLKNNKPFLVLVREKDLNDAERRFLKKCIIIKKTPTYNVYQMDVNTLQHLSANLFNDIENELSKSKTFEMDGFKYSDSVKSFIYNGFENNAFPNCFVGKGCYQGKIKDYNVLYKGVLPSCLKDSTYIVSFWMDKFTTDLFPRSTIELTFTDSTGLAYGADYFSVLDKNWALIERRFMLRNCKDQLTITVWNKNFVADNVLLRVDELLIKPLSTNLYKVVAKNRILKNNRVFVKQ
jgi:hypothetical protein